MRLVVNQSIYLPWKGFFDLLNSADHYIIYDSSQYCKGTFRNRNRIKTPYGTKWITVPIQRQPLDTSIDQIKTSDRNWGKKQWSLITQSYEDSPYFADYKNRFEPIFLNNQEPYLSKINETFIKAVCEILEIPVHISRDRDYTLEGDRIQRLIQLCKRTNATEYLSGPGAKDYLDLNAFSKENIKVTWMDYSSYSEYNQPHPPFEHEVSIIDLIFSEGPNATKYMKSFSGGTT